MLIVVAYLVGIIARILLAATFVLHCLAAVSLAAGAVSVCWSLWQGVLRSEIKSSLQDDGLRRISAFIRKVLPVVFHYKFVELRNTGKSDEQITAAFGPLNARYAPRALAICQEMQGFYIKLGQMCAGAGAGVMPKEYVDQLQVLLEDCPPVPFKTIEGIVTRAVGELSGIFESFDEWPLHTASIGQVHGARLHGGLDVVVKVQHPEAEGNFHIDIECFLQVARLLFREHVDELEQIRTSFATEFDYTKEAALQREAHSHLVLFPNVVVPLPIDSRHPEVASPMQGSTAEAGSPKQGSEHRSGLCTKHVLVMERLSGKSLACWGAEVVEAMAQAQGITKDEVLCRLRQMTPEQLERQKPSAVGIWMYTAGMQAGSVAYSAASTAYSVSAPLRETLNFGLQAWTVSAFDWLAGSVSPSSSSNALPAPPTFDLYSLPEVLFEVQGHMLFESGFVNTDPHPGNIMFLDDGRLGLIDWGQVKRLTVEQRCQLARAVIAVADDDEILAASFMRAMGMRTAKDLDWTYSRQAYFFLASWSDPRVLEIGGPLKVEEVLNKVDRIEEGVGEFWMPMRNQFFTRQCLAMLGFPRVNSACLLRPAAMRFLESRRMLVPRTTRRAAAPPPELHGILGSHAKRE